jgi:hypothetical protein
MRFSGESPVPTIRVLVRVSLHPQHAHWWSGIANLFSDIFFAGTRNIVRLIKLFGIESV